MNEMEAIKLIKQYQAQRICPECGDKVSRGCGITFDEFGEVFHRECFFDFREAWKELKEKLKKLWGEAK